MLVAPRPDRRAEALEWLRLEHPGRGDAADLSGEHANTAIARMLVARPA